MLKIADFKFAQKIPQSNNLPSTLLLESTTGAKDTGVSSKGSGNNTIGVEDVLKYRKGNSLYFAPELFTVDGVHSFHSDQWAVGCILYMMQVGSHPFEVINSSTSASMTLESLATRVSSYDPFVPDRLYPTQLETHVIDNLNHNPNPNPNLLSKSNQYSSRSYASPQATSRGTDPRRRIGSHDTPLSLPSNATESTNIPPKNREKISAQLCDLLRGLLTKCALYRPSWNAVETHPFWTRPESTPVPPSALPIVTIMPEQPAYELFLK